MRANQELQMLGKLRLTNQNKETAHSDDGRVPNVLPVLKIYSICDVNYRFSVLTVNSEHA